MPWRAGRPCLLLHLLTLYKDKGLTSSCRCLLLTSRARFPYLAEWRSIQSTPRAIREDPLFPGKLIFYPVEAIRTLRALPPAAYYARERSLPPHSSTPLPPAAASPRLDVELSFLPPFPSGASFGLSVLGGAANVTVDMVGDSTCGASTLVEAEGGGTATSSSSATSSSITTACANLTIGPHRGPFRFRTDAPLELRVLVDGSVVEGFVAGGRAAVTRRVYPASDAPLASSLINIGPAAVKLLSLGAYRMADVMGKEADRVSPEELRRKAAAR